MSLLLSEEERKRFIEYLDREAVTADLIAKEIENLGGSILFEKAKQERVYAVAARVVAERLRTTESFSTGGS